MKLVLAAVVALLALPAAAHAQDVDAAARALSKDYVYVAPGAEAAGEIDADALDRTIREADAGPVFVAVLPAAAAQGGTVDATLQALHDKAGISGTYVLVLGREFRAGSDELPVANLATAATRDHPGDIQATLTDFVGRVANARTDDDGIPTKVILIVLGPFLVAFTAVIFGIVWVVRKARRRRAEELAAVKRNVRDDLVALGDDIRALELDVQIAGRDSEAAQAYASAVEAYERANRRYEVADNVRDLRPVAEALEEGRYGMTWAREVLAGRTPPERRAPCFFDPRHGPSARDVAWAPEGGRRAPRRPARPTRSASSAGRSRGRGRSTAPPTGRPDRPTRRSTDRSSPAC